MYLPVGIKVRVRFPGLNLLVLTTETNQEGHTLNDTIYHLLNVAERDQLGCFKEYSLRDVAMAVSMSREIKLTEDEKAQLKFAKDEATIKDAAYLRFLADVLTRYNEL